MYIGDFTSGTVVDHRVGDSDNTRRKQRFRLYQSGSGIDMTIGIIKCAPQLECDLSPCREYQLSLRYLVDEGFEY